MFDRAEQTQTIAGLQRRSSRHKRMSSSPANGERFIGRGRLDDVHIFPERRDQHAQASAEQGMIVDKQDFHTRSLDAEGD